MNHPSVASHRLHMPLPAHRQHKSFFDALEQAEFGQLSLITPEGYKREFFGAKPGPIAHLKLYDWHVLDEFMARGEMGLADAYIAGRWASINLPELLTYGLQNATSLEKFFYGKPVYILMTYMRQLLRKNSLGGSRRNILAHYNLGNNFYALWLDKGMTYSCALFEGDNNRTLEEAQDAKYKRILNKLEARPGSHILEIGCGWGGFAEAAARRGINVTAITLSDQQAHYASERLRKAGLEHLASVELMDYRKLSGQYDHIVSIGMFEHVGEQYWPVYFETIKKHLKPGGSVMIQTITIDDHLFETLHDRSGFMEQVIFPGGMLPSKPRFCAAAAHAKLECQETFSFGSNYEQTARCWLERFHARKEEVKALGYDEAFLRLWRFYLSACIASFASRRTDVMQVKLTHAS